MLSNFTVRDNALLCVDSTYPVEIKYLAGSTVAIAVKYN